MPTISANKRVQGAFWATLLALLLAVIFVLPAQAAGPDGPHLRFDDGEPITVQGPRQVFRDDLTVGSGEVIEDDVFVYSGDVDIEAGGRITGDLVVFSGDIEMGEGSSIEGDVLNYSGDVVVGGTIGGDLAAMNGSVELGSTARVDGDISVVSGQIEREEGASVGGNVVQGPSFRFPGRVAPDAPDRPDSPGISLGSTSQSLMGRIGSFIARLFLAALMTALVMLLVGGLFYLRPQLIADTRRHLNKQLALSAVVGVLANLTALFLAMLLAITICLLPLALVPLLLLLAVNVVGWTVASQIAGERIVSATKQDVQPALTVLVGAFVLTGVCALLWAMGGCFRFVASLLIFAVSSLGAGAVLVPWINRRRGSGGSGNRGGDDLPPREPSPSGPGTGEGESATPTAPRSPIVPQTFGQGADAGTVADNDIVEHDRAQPIDYMTAEEINATAEQAPKPRSRSGRKPATTESQEDASSGEAQDSDPVEQDVAQPLDYVTAQEVNTEDAISEGDDFLRIKGIGPTYARRLKDAGYATFADVAAATPEEIGAAIGWPVDRVQRSELIDQAKVLARS